MNEPSPGILILGGGVTGMSAALALKDQDIEVHLVETQDRLGGHAAQWACMATDTCQNCGACLAQEMVDQVQNSDAIHLHLDTELTGLERAGQGLEATLSSGTTLTAAKVLMATGFAPFDPAAIPSYHTPTLKKVITTAQLNQLMTEGRLGEILTDRPKIAFLQCVGSRDREQNRDYCSQVCCKISMRHAQKLTHTLPDAQVSLFYMDLQIIGKETRTMAATLADTVQLVQGVPAEILEDQETGQLTMVTEDPATGSRQALAFDLIVLSVGMVPGEQGPALAQTLGASPNPWGFFNTPEADIPQDLFIAGCAKGPMNINSAVEEGRIAAADILCQINSSANQVAESTGQPAEQRPSIAVMGSGPDACAVAAAVAETGHEPILFGRAETLPQGARALKDTQLLSVEGSVGQFSILYHAGGTKQRLDCAAIIAAPRPHDQNRAGQIAGAVSLSQFASLAPDARPDSSLILLDYFGPESKARARQALLTAIETRGAGKDVDILMNKMLVHGPTGQQLYDKARKLGVGFLRYEHPSDLDIHAGEENIEISFQEATLPGLDITLTPATLVLPETPAPAAQFQELARLLRQELDSEGFLQPANSRHRLVQSSRKGIYFAGQCHDDIAPEDLEFEIRAILADINAGARLNGQLTVNENSCARCLTCYRVCPHAAIELNGRHAPRIMAEACFECYTCLSNCPAFAISAQGQANSDLIQPAQKGRTLIFACERSAALAAKDNLPSDTDLTPISCACRISPEVLLGAMVKGVDRVVVCGCHEGNCRSGNGPATARRNVAQVSSFPGIPEGKTVFRSVAANEPVALTNLLSKAKRG